MNQQPDNIRKMWEEAARINEAKKAIDPSLAALEAEVKRTGDLWGAKSASTSGSAAEKKFRAARAALAAAKAAKK